MYISLLLKTLWRWGHLESWYCNSCYSSVARSRSRGALDVFFFFFFLRRSDKKKTNPSKIHFFSLFPSDGLIVCLGFNQSGCLNSLKAERVKSLMTCQHCSLVSGWGWGGAGKTHIQENKYKHMSNDSSCSGLVCVAMLKSAARRHRLWRWYSEYRHHQRRAEAAHTEHSRGGKQVKL